MMRLNWARSYIWSSKQCVGYMVLEWLLRNLVESGTDNNDCPIGSFQHITANQIAKSILANVLWNYCQWNVDITLMNNSSTLKFYNCNQITETSQEIFYPKIRLELYFPNFLMLCGRKLHSKHVEFICDMTNVLYKLPAQKVSITL